MMTEHINSSVYNRLVKLFKVLGLDVTPNSLNDGEIYCYSRAIESIRSEFKKSLENTLASNINSIEIYKDLLNINTHGKAYDEIIDEIIHKITWQFGNFDVDQMNNDFKQLGFGSYTITDLGFVFKDVKFYNLVDLHKFTDAWNPFFKSYYYDANGQKMTFDEWDKESYNWGYYDAAKLCWDFLESYKEVA